VKAALWKEKGLIAVEEVPTPHPGPGEIVIKVKYCAICGSDVHRAFIFGMMNPNVILGHEFSGTVHELGQGVSRWKVGDRVVGGGGTPPPEMASKLMGVGFRAPRYSARTVGLAIRDTMGGAYAEYVLMKDWQPLPIPEGVSDITAALTEPCATSLHATRISGIKLGDKVGIIGAGPIGLFALQCARAAGASKTIVADLSTARREAAQKLGADILIDPKETNTVEAMLDATNGIGPDIIYECAGAPVTLDQALSAVRREGRVMYIALGWEPTPTLPVEWVGREVEMKCCYAHSSYEWEIVLDLMAKKKIEVDPVMVRPNDYFALDNIQQAFEQCVNPTDRIQAVIVP